MFIHANTPCYVGWRLPDHQVEHDRGGDGQAVPAPVSRQISAREVADADAAGVASCEGPGTHQVKMYCAWLLRRFTSAGRPMGMPLFWYSRSWK
jgi:hypothetical protein